MGIRDTWESGQTAVGAWCTTGSAFAAELLSRVGYDYVCLDQQHGLLGPDSYVASLSALALMQTAAITRVLSNDGPGIGRALDAGATGVIVPMINTREDAERAVRACRYAPLGERSFGPVRSRFLYGRDPELANREVLCIAMVETEEAVRNVREICGVPGIDGIYIGPADLALTMGLPPSLDIRPGPHAEAIQKVLDTCNDLGVVAGIHCGSAGQAIARSEMGFRMVSAISDVTVLVNGASSELEAFRKAVTKGNPIEQTLQ